MSCSLKNLKKNLQIKEYFYKILPHNVFMFQLFQKTYLS